MNENLDQGKVWDKIRRQHDQMVENNNQKDKNSHFITRLAFCFEEEKTRWFISQESRLFKARIANFHKQLLKQLAEQMKIEFQILVPKEFNEVENELKESFPKAFKKNKNLTNNEFFKVNFRDALFFVGNLKCFLKRGVAYLYETDISTLLMDAFKAKLQKQMVLARQHYLSILERDERLAPLLKNISDAYIGKDYSTHQTKSKHGKINLAELDILSKRSFPACMRHLYDNFKLLHHLRHDGRLQLSLFLKGGGLSYEDAYVWFKQEFTKKITSEQFEKQYAYNIRYNYGKEGNRTDWTPKSCANIIKNHPPGNGEFHGCPFRHLSEGNLSNLLKKMGIDTNSKPFMDVLDKVRGKHYQIACRYVFQILHPNRSTNLEAEFDGQHPNSYFESSLKYYAGERAFASNNKPDDAIPAINSVNK